MQNKHYLYIIINLINLAHKTANIKKKINGRLLITRPTVGSLSSQKISKQK